MEQLEQFCDSLDIVLRKLLRLSKSTDKNVSLPSTIQILIKYEWESNTVFDTTKKIYPRLEQIFSPKNLGAIAASSVSEIPHRSDEVWFYGDSLMIVLTDGFNSDARYGAVDILKELLE